jgi:MFS family permease
MAAQRKTATEQTLCRPRFAARRTVPRDEVRGAIHRLALSRAVTYTGGSSAYIALLSVLYERTRSPTLVAAGAFASFAVPALVSPATGWIGDRYDRRTVLVLSELSGALFSLAMALTVLPSALLAFRVLASLAASPMVPLTAAALPGIARSPEELAWANSQLTAAGMAGLVVGPVMAALLLAAFSPSAIFLINAATFVLSAHLILSVRSSFQQKAGSAGEGRRAVAAGFRFLRQDRTLRFVSIAYASVFLGLGLSAPGEIALSDQLSAGSSGYAVLMALWAMGGVVGAQLGRRSTKPTSAGLVLAIAAGGLAVGLAGLASPRIFLFALLAMFLVGASEALWQVVQHLLIQTAAPDNVRSRAFASSEAIGQGGMAIGLILAGPLIGHLGVATAFGVASVSCIFGTLTLLPAIAQGKPACSRPNAESRAPGAGSLPSHEGSPPPSIPVGRRREPITAQGR